MALRGSIVCLGSLLVPLGPLVVRIARHGVEANSSLKIAGAAAAPSADSDSTPPTLKLASAAS